MPDEVDPADPLFTSVEMLRDTPVRDGVSTNAATVGDLVEEWTGNAGMSRLGDPE